MISTNIRTSDFDYYLPQHMIAQSPAEPRDSSRLMSIDRATGVLRHQVFSDIVKLLKPGDLLVVNDSRVIPARLKGHRIPSGGRVEILLLNNIGPGTWKALVKPGKRLGSGQLFDINGIAGQILDDPGDGTRVIHLDDSEVIRNSGEIPLPPYIKASLANPDRYQTVYAKTDGSVAAPTAGLHFTTELLEILRLNGVELARVMLHVGLDTFKPVEVEDPLEHKIHSEYFEFGDQAAKQVNTARNEGRRIICVGTTTMRVLEQVAVNANNINKSTLQSQSGWANLFILPGHQFQVADGLITNFHLPKSSLLMLVAAFMCSELANKSDLQLLTKAYEEAKSTGYRFYSLGDCMFIS